MFRMHVLLYSLLYLLYHSKRIFHLHSRGNNKMILIILKLSYEFDFEMVRCYALIKIISVEELLVEHYFVNREYSIFFELLISYYLFCFGRWQRRYLLQLKGGEEWPNTNHWWRILIYL